jgi:hypothetical protein
MCALLASIALLCSKCLSYMRPKMHCYTHNQHSRHVRKR